MSLSIDDVNMEATDAAPVVNKKTKVKKTKVDHQLKLEAEDDFDFGDDITEVLTYVETKYINNKDINNYHIDIPQNYTSMDKKLNKSMVQIKGDKPMKNAFRIGQLKNLIDQLFQKSSDQVITQEYQSDIMKAFTFYIKIKSLFFKNYITTTFNNQYQTITTELEQLTVKIQHDHTALNHFWDQITKLKNEYVKNNQQETEFRNNISKFLIDRFNTEANKNENERAELEKTIDRIEYEKNKSQQEVTEKLNNISNLQKEIEKLQQNINLLNEKIKIMDADEIANASEIEEILSERINILKRKIETLYGEDYDYNKWDQHLSSTTPYEDAEMNEANITSSVIDTPMLNQNFNTFQQSRYIRQAGNKRQRPEEQPQVPLTD